MEILLLAWDRHKTWQSETAEWNHKPSPFRITNYKKPQQIQFHSKRPYSITKIELQHKHGQNYTRVN